MLFELLQGNRLPSPLFAELDTKVLLKNEQPFNLKLNSTYPSKHSTKIAAKFNNFNSE
jgi:hypothetical protein